MKSEQSQFGTPVDTQHPLGGGFDCDLMELKLLRDEIENLQFELAERDRQMPSTHGNQTDEMTEDSAELEALVEQFEARMKEMARELESSEDRIRTLNDLLQACEEANIAERDERQHMEKWLAEIESRLGETDEALKLEVEQLQLRCQRKDEILSRAEEQIRKMVADAGKMPASSEDRQRDSQQVLQLNAQVKQLERNIEDLLSDIAELQKQNSQATEDAEQVRLLRQQIAALELEAAKERAEISRQRVELQAAKDELIAHQRDNSTKHEADQRIRAMREHLREIHQDEELRKGQEPAKSGIASRISKLLGKV